MQYTRKKCDFHHNICDVILEKGHFPKNTLDKTLPSIAHFNVILYNDIWYQEELLLIFLDTKFPVQNGGLMSYILNVSI